MYIHAYSYHAKFIPCQLSYESCIRFMTLLCTIITASTLLKLSLTSGFLVGTIIKRQGTVP